MPAEKLPSLRFLPLDNNTIRNKHVVINILIVRVGKSHMRLDKSQAHRGW